MRNSQSGTKQKQANRKNPPFFRSSLFLQLTAKRGSQSNISSSADHGPLRKGSFTKRWAIMLFVSTWSQPEISTVLFRARTSAVNRVYRSWTTLMVGGHSKLLNNFTYSLRKKPKLKWTINPATNSHTRYIK